MNKFDEDMSWHQVGKMKTRTKAQQQAALKRMPKVSDLDHTTAHMLLHQYDAEDLGEPLQDTSNVIKPTVQTGIKTETKHKKRQKKTVESKFTFKNIEEALNKDDFQLDDKLVQIKSAFPENASIWPKEISSYLNLCLNCPDENFSAGRPFDFPLCKAKKKTAKTLRKLYVEDTTSAAVPPMFHQYVAAMLDSIAKDVPSWGYKLCIQTLAHNHPKLCCQDLSIFKDKVAMFLNMPKQCIALLWAIGQTAEKNVKCGFQIWLELMLPYLHVKQVATFSMHYLDIVFNKAKDPVVELESLLQVTQFIKIAKLCYGNSTSTKLSIITCDLLKKKFSLFQEMVLRKKSGVYELFKSLQQNSYNEATKLQEIFTELQIECLIKDPSCFKIWRDDYRMHILQSKLLLSYIDIHWVTVYNKLARKSIHEILQFFVNNNLEDEKQKNPVINDKNFAKFKELCKILNSRCKISQKKSLFWFPKTSSILFFVSLGLLIGYIHYDIQSHGEIWKKSTSYKLLNSYGVIAFTNLIVSKLKNWTRILFRWLSINIPYHMQALSNIFGPYLVELTSYFQSIHSAFHSSFQLLFNSITNENGFLMIQISELLKVGTKCFIDILDLSFDFAYLFCMWSWHNIKNFNGLLYELYKGEITWKEAQSGMNVQFQQFSDLFFQALQKVGSFIAPNKP